MGNDGGIFVGEKGVEIGGAECIDPCGIGSKERCGPIVGGDAHFCDGFEHIEWDRSEEIDDLLGDGVWKPQTEGMKGHALEVEGVVMEVVLFVVAALAVADDGMVDPAEVTAQLVKASCEGDGFDDAAVRAACKTAVGCKRRDTGAVFIAGEGAVDQSLFGGDTTDEGDVMFLKLALHKKLIEKLRSFFVSGDKQDAAGGAVETMGEIDGLLEALA